MSQGLRQEIIYVMPKSKAGQYWRAIQNKEEISHENFILREPIIFARRFDVGHPTIEMWTVHLKIILEFTNNLPS
jgi:hypothetical protein